MSEVPARWYPSKVDWWMWIALAIPIVSSTVVVISAFVSHKGYEAAVIAPAVMTAIFVGLVFPMRYGMNDTHLLVRHGLVTQRVELKQIRRVQPTRNPLSSPALSLDRLNIEYGTEKVREVMISPAQREDFLAELSQRTGLKRDGGGLSRR